MGHLPRAALALGSVGMVGLAAATLVAAHRNGDETLGGGRPGELAALGGVGLSLWGAGCAIGVVRSAWLPGLLLAASGAAFLLGGVPLPDAGGTLLFSAALAGGSCAAALAGVSALAYRRSARPFPDVLISSAALATTGLWLGVFPAVTFDPPGAGCFACPRNLLLVHAEAGLHARLVHSGLYAAAAACAVLAVVTLGRWLRSDRVSRSVVAPVLVGGAAAAAIAAAGFAYEARSGGIRVVDSTTHALWLAQSGALALVAAGVMLELGRARLLSHRVATMIVEAFPTAQELRAALAAAAGDPGLSVVFPQADGSIVDSEGAPVEPTGDDLAAMRILRERGTVAELRHADTLAHAPERLADAARSAGLALEYASSRARLRAQFRQLTESRARIVEVGDEERQRLERNLHDGAQQRLIALSMALLVPPYSGAAVTRARLEILAALAELRALAHGIHPAALTDAGLGAALRELADSSRVPMRLEGLTPERFARAVETAVYRLALDSVRCAEVAGDGRAVTVALDYTRGSLRARVTLPGVDIAKAALVLEHTFDRFAALAGSYRTDTVADGAEIEVTLPCAS